MRTNKSQLVKWRDAHARLNVRGRVTLPFDNCRITEIGDQGLTLAVIGDAPYWIPYTAITFIGEA